VRAAVYLAIAALLSASTCVAAERTISLYNIHTKEHLTITYRRNGKYIPAALEKLNWFLRDFRRNKKIKMDPELIDLAWQIHTELGSHQPIHVISGYRSPATNAMLRRTRGGQARRSQHMVGRAMDIHFPDISIRRLRYSALIRERGGVGYYPTSAIPFVHIDTARVRHWPRMSRPELALLFPSGRTKHRPARGGPITHSDVVAAMHDRPKLYQRIAAFRSSLGRLHDGRRTRLASAVNPFSTTVIRPPRPTPAIRPPRLTSLPRLARRTPATSDRNQLARMARLASASGLPSLNSLLTPSAYTNGDKPLPSGVVAEARRGARTEPPRPTPPIQRIWAHAPEYDEEHPEELSYRPFPILPLLTADAGHDHPLLKRLVHPDPARTLDLLDEAADLPSLQLRPGKQVIRAMWFQAFSGQAVALDVLFDARRASGQRTLEAHGPITSRHRRIATAQ
jgi:uncharacterized protein YcbK (DUF882 family)